MAAFCLAFFSASQDILVDAVRIDPGFGRKPQRVIAQYCRCLRVALLHIRAPPPLSLLSMPPRRSLRIDTTDNHVRVNGVVGLTSFRGLLATFHNLHNRAGIVVVLRKSDFRAA